MPDAPPDAAPRRALPLVFLTMLLDVVGIGLTVPVVPALLRTLTHGSLADASRLDGWLAFVYAGLLFASAPALGVLSDRVGRRGVLLVSLAGLGADHLVRALAPTAGWLFLGRALAGLGGFSFATATAYLADVSTPERRAQTFGLVGVAFGLGFIVGPAVGGALGQVDVRLPFFVAAGLSAVNVALAALFLPESLLSRHRRRPTWRDVLPLGTLRRLGRRPAVRGFVVGAVLLNVAGQALQSTWTYVTMERYAWTTREVGYSLAFVGLVVAVVQGGVARRAMPALGEGRVARLGLALYALGFLLFAWAPQGWMMLAGMVPYGLAGLAGPALQGLASRAVGASEQGELQGAYAGLNAVGGIAGPLLMTRLFAAFTSPGTPVYLPGAPFVAGAALVGLAALVVHGALRRTEGTSVPA